MQDNPDILVSVIIATYNRNQVLCETLDSVFAQRYEPFEIIVVDQSAQHEPLTQAYLETHQSRFHWIRLEKPGLPNARNVGIREAKGQILIFCDDDVELASDWILYHVANYSDPQVGCVGGRIIERGLPVLPNQDNDAYINIWGRPKGNFTSTRRTEIKTVRGGNMSVRKSVFEKIGLFDTHYIGSATLEETDLTYRIVNTGYNAVFDPRAELLHKPQLDGNDGSRKNKRIVWYRNYLHNSTLFLLKNKPRYEVIPFLLSQFLIAFKQGFLGERDLRAFFQIFSGVYAGFRSYKIQSSV